MEAQWKDLGHAYGSASDIPELLLRAETDLRGGHEQDSTWFSLWSALCHQGDIYSASYAAVPHLVRLAQLAAYRGNYEPLWLAAHIELAHREGHGPALPASMATSYQRSLETALLISQEASALPLDKDAQWVYTICIAIFSGDVGRASELLDQDA